MRRERLPDLIICARSDWADGCPQRAVEIPTADDKVHSLTAESDAERELPLTPLSERVPRSASPQEEAA